MSCDAGIPRSAAHHVAPAFICLISTLIAGGAHAQTVTDPSASKRVQVLQIREVSATDESSVKKSKTVATPAKKKVVQRKTIRQTKAAAREDPHAAETQLANPNRPVQSAMAVVTPATPAQNDTPTLFAEQTGTLAVGDRSVGLASSSEDNNVGFSDVNSLGTKEDQWQARLPSEIRSARSPTSSKSHAQMVGRPMLSAETPLCHNRWQR